MKWLVILSLAVTAPVFAGPPRILFDTDITGDVDDVLALAMCHSLADRGACEFLGVTVSKNHPLTGPFVDAINTCYGRPDLPIGVTRDAQAQHRESKYLKLAAAYPHDLIRNEDAPEAVDLIRDLLAASPDRSVTIVSVGIASNLAALLDSKGDSHSPLDGSALIGQKVKTLSIMAGAFTFANGTNRHLEANVINGIGYMRTVADRWPDEVPILWSGYEIGRTCLTLASASRRISIGWTNIPCARPTCCIAGPNTIGPAGTRAAFLSRRSPDVAISDSPPRAASRWRTTASPFSGRRERTESRAAATAFSR